jgi:hypothetical protein
MQKPAATAAPPQPEASAAQSHTPHADASAVAAPASTLSEREQRLLRTQKHVGDILSQLSWKEPTTESSSTAPVQSADSSAPVVSASSQGSLLGSSRPFDRAAFLARVGTFSPLRWMHRREAGARTLSPLFLARWGWSVAEDESQRDRITCTACGAQVQLKFDPEVLALAFTTPAVVLNLARRYAREVVPSAHKPQCPWVVVSADEDFTRIVPGGAKPSSVENEGVSDSQRAVVLGQAEQRAATLRQHALPSLWSSFTLHTNFVDAVAEVGRAIDGASASKSAAHLIAHMPVTTVLALCGWEMRNNSTCLQCCFGCREIGALDRFCCSAAQLPSSEETKEEHEDAAEEEDGRSFFQSPLKRRKLHSQDHRGLAQKRPDGFSPLQSSPAGFHAAREHRPFCPFLLPLREELDDSPIAALAASASVQSPVARSSAPHATSSAASPVSAPPVSSVSSARDESLSGWQQVLRWWLQREQSKAAMAVEQQSAAAEQETAAQSSRARAEAQGLQALGVVRKLLSHLR